jgi:hypothetical protein
MRCSEPGMASQFAIVASRGPGLVPLRDWVVRLPAMKPSILSDERLPTWLHTIVVIVIASVFGIPPLVWGIEAMAAAQLPEMRGWDNVIFLSKLDGNRAFVAGGSLICLGLTFLTLGLGFTRWAQRRAALRLLPWLWLALFALLYLSVFVVK